MQHAVTQAQRMVDTQEQELIPVAEARLSLNAKARRRRMQRRQAKRRLTRVGAVAAVVFAGAIALTPERKAAMRPATITADSHSKPTNVRLASAKNGALVAALNTPSVLWTPAGKVLTRKAKAPASLPFGLDPRETERGESLSRWHRIYLFSTQYRIKPELARRIYDASITAGLEPELGFRLVRVESVFKTDAVSPAGAIGLTQLMVGTAREFEKGVTRVQLLNPDVNLRIGFKYLRSLIREYKDLKLALLVYNRGPVAVKNAISLGLDPTNGYEHVIMRGYRGKGVLE